jgi:hypothetical protein
MAALTHTSKKLSALGFGALALSGAFLAFGAGTASADQNTGPALNEMGPPGVVVATGGTASTAGGDLCMVSPGLLSTASTRLPEMNVPTQIADESGPAWVGSQGYAVQAIPRNDPFVGQFHNGAPTGPACSPVEASNTTGIKTGPGGY